MRPRLPLASRLSKFLELPVEDIQATLEDFQPEDVHAPHWPWLGQFQNLSPIMFYDGRPRPARRVIYEQATGQKLPADIRLERFCDSFLCVHPSHSRLKQLNVAVAEPEIDIAAELELAMTAEDSLDDVIASVYDADTFDLTELLNLPYEPALIERALSMILSGEA